VNGARSAFLGLVLAVAVTVAYRGIVGLVSASGARDQPGVVLILLLSAFLGVLTAVATRMLRLPGATAPTVLVLGWTLIPLLLAAIPSAGAGHMLDSSRGGLPARAGGDAATTRAPERTQGGSSVSWSVAHDGEQEGRSDAKSGTDVSDNLAEPANRVKRPFRKFPAQSKPMHGRTVPEAVPKWRGHDEFWSADIGRRAGEDVLTQTIEAIRQLARYS
jgi:hypothetical protein